MIIAISQPTLYPWLGFFDIIKKSDIFVFLDDVQFNRHSWQQNNRIKDPTDEETWLNIPVKKTHLDSNINEIQIDNSKNWQKKHVRTLETCYGKNFKEIEWLHEFYDKEWKYLSDFNMKFIKKCCKYLEINTKFSISSELNISSKKTEKLINTCKFYSADSYLTTIGAKKYYLQDEEYLFDNAEIQVIYHNYKHPSYSQRGKKFIPYMSILDLIFNLGSESKFFYL